MENKLEDFIKANRARLDTGTPDPAVLSRLLEQMQGRQKPAPAGLIIPFSALRWAAACLLVAGAVMALWTFNKRAAAPKVARVGAIRKAPDSNPVITGSTAHLQVTAAAKPEGKGIERVEKELTARKQSLYAKLRLQSGPVQKTIMFAGLNNTESTASRINALSYAYRLKNTGRDVVDALVESLNNDPSANVRLAALDGLARFYRDAYVRQKLVNALKKQQDPVVQITLINLLTRMRESGIIDELDKLINDDNTIKAVKDCAYSSINQLRST